MLFSVDQRLLHCNAMLRLRTNLQTCPTSTCRMYRCKLARQSRLQKFLKVGIATGDIYILLTKAYFVINDFSDIVFFKKDSYPTWRLLFEDRAPSS